MAVLGRVKPNTLSTKRRKKLSSRLSQLCLHPLLSARFKMKRKALRTNYANFVVEKNNMVLLSLYLYSWSGRRYPSWYWNPSLLLLKKKMNHWDAYFTCKTIKENFLKDQLRHYHVNHICSYTQRNRNCVPGSRNNIWKEHVVQKKNQEKEEKKI